MTTKDKFLFSKNPDQVLPKEVSQNDYGNQYSNLNLNQIQKCPLLLPVYQSYSKTFKDKNCVSDSCKEKEKVQLWNKSSDLNSLKLNGKSEDDGLKKLWKKDYPSNANNNSTLSLYITAYENSNKSNQFGEENAELKSNKIDLNNHIFSGSIIQSPFEFPRQQESDQITDPELMQFRASQRLHNPNQPIVSNNSQFINGTAGHYPAQNVPAQQIHQQQSYGFQQPSLGHARFEGSSKMDEVRVDEDELTKEIESFSIINDDDNEEKVYQGVNNNDSGAEISMEARQSQWVNLLGVRNKPDQLIDWDHLYNLNDQAELRKQCQKVVENVQNNGGDRERKTKVTVPALESMMTLWCKKRKIQNASKVHWTDLMTVLIEMDFDNPTLFNIFYAITTKYIPRDIDESGKTYDLFRLIMQYHDPEICSHLDSLKITPYSYASSWFNSLFSKDLDVKLCLQLWDIYFEKGDPFLVFFISLCLVQSARDQILQMKDKNEIITFLRDIPKNMSVEDITDLIDVCKVSMSLTPLSVQEDFHCMLFGANMVEDFYELPLQTLLCLPISVQELYKRSVDGGAYGVMMPYNYFVIDTRSQKEFSSGSIPGSYNLSGRLLVDAPEKFTNAMTTLMRFKKESCATDHICFFGSGLEEDDSYMVMVISSFLHKNVNHISYVDGGYKALHSVLKETNNLNKLSNHFDGNACLHCNGQKAEAKESFTWSVMERMNQRRKGLKDAAKNISEYFPKLDIFGRENAQHAKSNERNQKRYRNVQSVFTLEDSDESDNDATFELDASNANERLKWSDIIKKPEITHNFEGLEILPDKSVTPCFIALSRTHMHVFHEVPEDKSFIKTSARHSLGTVMRVSSKKQHPEYLTFQFGYELPTGEAHINRIQKFVVSKSGELATACKNNIFALRPNLFD